MLFVLIYFLDDAMVPTVAWVEAFAVCCHSIRVVRRSAWRALLRSRASESVSSKPRTLGPSKLMVKKGGYRELAGSVARGEALVICIRGPFDVCDRS